MHQERSGKAPLEQNSFKGIHLYVFVHGFQASSYDLRAFKNCVALKHPRVLFLCSTSNEELTEGPIEVMGKNLAKEVKSYIREWCYSKDHKTLYMSRLSFVGHSLGGLIIRSALPFLEEYKSFMHGFMTLGSPHLGYMYNSNSLINAGMWFLKNWKSSESLKQLSMSDKSSPKDCYLYKLSKSVGLSWFKHLVFLGSNQDRYAPYDSSRVQLCSRAMSNQNDENNRLFIKMTQNILSRLSGGSCEKIIRIDVNFKIDESNLDALIGRTAHILLVECEPLIEILVH